METSEILQRAKQELLTRGWCQGEYQNDRDELCAVGALSAACGGLMQPAMRATEWFCETIGYHHVPTWNDRPERTPEEVLAAFDAAIARAQQREALPRMGETLWDTAAVPAAVVDAPATVAARSGETTDPSGGDRANTSLSHYLGEWTADAIRAVGIR